jgi:hypothetical protein
MLQYEDPSTCLEEMKTTERYMSEAQTLIQERTGVLTNTLK